MRVGEGKGGERGGRVFAAALSGRVSVMFHGGGACTPNYSYWQSFALEGALFFLSLLFVIVLCCSVV